VRSIRRGAGLILFYHRIAEPAYDPWMNAVSAATFERHLRLLKDDYRVMTLADLALAARRGRVPPRAVAVTFDDGYLDNLQRALPALEAHGVPATCYVATGYVDSPRPFWWDDLEDLLAGAGERPPRLEIALGRTRVSAATASEAERRRVLTATMQPLLRRSSPAAIGRWLELLRAWAGEIPPGGDDARRPMSGEELDRLARSELVELGAHTATHPSLLALGRRQQRAEIEASRRFLTERFGRPPSSFSFPFGENSVASRRLVRACGFESAVGVQGALPVTAAARRFELPRLMAVEEPAEALAARMEATLRAEPAPL
jgi:peptidoglycan/xylan/chitin deacetylase (PgdA/CDA1 family)